MKASLKFPESNDGTIEGISDAGIETFTGDLLGSLAREQAQNSIDARAPNTKKPVKVRYELLDIPTKIFPGIKELREAVQRSEEYWNERCAKTKRILDRASRALQKPVIRCLKITDRNTTGLTGSHLKDSGNWFNLTKSSGVSEKSNDTGGSFGIGKNAFFANSVFRTVFFATTDIEGRSAFQGVTKLVSHKATGRGMTRATGFYGNPQRFLPIVNLKEIPEVFQCSGVGTDIVIAGFEPQEGWQTKLIAAFADNFFVAIHDGLLEVEIQRGDDPKAVHELNSATLGDVVQALANENPKAYGALQNLYDALVSPEAQEFDTDIEGLGKLTLRLLQREAAQKRIAMFRKTGMKIFEKGHFRTPVEFAGVFRCIGEKGNALLRLLEPPSHDKWEPERYDEDPSKARSLVAEINHWMRNCVEQLQVADPGDKQFIPGLERFLPDDFEDPFDSPQPAVVEGDPKPHEQAGVKGLVRPPRIKRAETSGDDFGREEEGGSAGDGADGRGSQGGGGGVGTDEGGGGNEASREIAIEYRAFRDPAMARYRMIARFPSAGSYDILLFALGDDGRAEPVDLKEPKLVAGDKTSRASTSAPNRISKLKIDTTDLVEIQFAIPSAIPRTILAKVHQNGKP
ncbi:MAG: hypothetical protein M0Z68_00985 [Gammaproteobacteria bacterium]|nr:hypothetical protein [Gammaproteobacteria bacterium]